MLRQALACCLSLTLLVLPAPAWAKSLKASVPFSRGATNPAVSLVFKRPAEPVVIVLPDAGLVPEIQGPFPTDSKKPSSPPPVRVPADGGALSSKTGTRTFVVAPAYSSIYPANYRLILRGTATGSGNASIRAEYKKDHGSSSSCEGFGPCFPTGFQAVLLAPLLITILIVWTVQDRLDTRRERKAQKEMPLLPTRFTIKMPKQMAEGSPISLRLDADRGVLLQPRLVTVTESCRAANDAPPSEPVVTLLYAKAVRLEKWHSLSLVYTPQQAGLCELEIRVEGQTGVQKSYALTAKTKPLTILGSSSRHATTP